MNAKNTLIALLALTTIGGGALAWHQYQELVDTRAAALRAGERADLQKKISALQKANQELEAQLAAAHSGMESPDEAIAATDRPAADEGGRDRRGARGNRGQQFAVMRELMQKPEVQALMSTAQKGLVDARYAALFRSLNLTPQQADKLSQLLVDRQNAVRDVMQAARDQGVSPRTDPQGFQKLVADAEGAVNDSIKSLIGDSGYSQLTNYDQTMPQRNVVNALQQRLSYTGSPLSASQSDQLVQILASNAPVSADGSPIGAQNGGGGRGRGGPGGFGGGMFEGAGGVAALAGPGAAEITPQAVAQAGTVLDSTQLSTLQQLQQQQQAAEQLRQLARSTWQQTNATGATAAPSQTGAPGTSAGAAPGGTATTGRRPRGGG